MEIKNYVILAVFIQFFGIIWMLFLSLFLGIKLMVALNILGMLLACTLASFVFTKLLLWWMN